jgi:hypothetical protein
MMIQPNNALRSKLVILATVARESKLDVFYVHSLSDTIKSAMNAGIIVMPVFIGNDRSIPMAKNDLLKIAFEQDVDSIVFVDHDLAWDANEMVRLMTADAPVAVLPVISKKPNSVIYDIDFDKSNPQFDKQGLLKVTYASTACMKLDKTVIQALMNSNVSITDENNNDVKVVFEHQTQYGRFFNESMVLCNKLKDLGIDIWAIPTTTCSQNTINLFTADFPGWLDSIRQSTSVPQDIKSLYE